MTNPSNKDNPSSVLKATREQKGISLEMVHEATKIPLDALKAIEQGYSVHRLPPFYYRGFIRIYSKYLELEEAKVLESYGIHDAPKPQPLVVREAKLKPRTTPQAIPEDNFVKDTLKPLLKRNLTGPRLRQAGKFLALLVCLFLAFKIVGCMVHNAKAPKPPKVQKADLKPVVPSSMVKPLAKEKEKSRSKKEETPAIKIDHPIVAAPAVSEVTQVKAQEPKPVPAKTESKSESKSEKKSRRIELTVRATKSGWLQVKTDGQIVFQSMLKKGAAETWSASDEIELSGKNINLLEFELNGKLLGALGPTDRGAKRVVFTKDGLSVKK
jgi:cytoskeletal protein RodZ